MKHKEINEIVNQHFDVINKLFHKINTDFNTDDIHDFRIEVKKLRAFLRLLAMDRKKTNPLIPTHIKTFYGYIGIIRNIQLHRHNLFKYLGDNKVQKPDEYLKLIETEENYWKKEVAILLKENFEKKEEKIITRSLPAKLEKNLIDKFLKNNLKNLKYTLVEIPDEEGIHVIRKILKDILYCYEYIKSNEHVPKTFSEKKYLQSLTAILGDFIDKCIQIEFLQSEYVNPIKNKNEKIVLANLKKQLGSEKNDLLKELKPRFDELKKLTP